jgi:hypothetical protein
MTPTERQRRHRKRVAKEHAAMLNALRAVVSRAKGGFAKARAVLARVGSNEP